MKHNRFVKSALAPVIIMAAPTLCGAVDLAEYVHPVIPGLVVTVVRQSPPTTPSAYCPGASILPAITPTECSVPNMLDATQGPMGYDAAGNRYEASFGQAQLYENGNFYAGKAIYRTTPTGVSEPIVLLRSDTSAGLLGGMFATSLTVDTTNGRIFVPLKVAVGGGSLVYGLVEVTGLPTLFDTLLTFLPGGGALSAFTPAHPDGFRSADALQVWTGDARSMPDWSQAQSLTCAAATNPLPGQVVTFADSLPDPALGHARYYLVSSVSGPDRRLGRQYVNAVYSARNPTTLPVCVP